MLRKAENDKRLVSLDALRGFDMLFIMGGDALVISIAAMFPGEMSDYIISEQMGHKAWHGFAFYDLIFPLFLFLAGVSFPFSLAKQLSMRKSRLAISLKIVFRVLLLLLLGMVYNGLFDFDFENMRYASVLGRIGLAWGIAALVYLWIGVRWSVVLSLTILLGYWALLALVRAPDAEAIVSTFSMQGSIVGYIDRLYMPGVLHLGIHDPEGILSTLPAVVTAMFGIFTGSFVKSGNLNGYKKVGVMFLCSLSLLAIGLLWNKCFPINKNLWTSSFVCYAGGWSLLLLTIFYLFIDVFGFRKCAFPLCVIGVNSITIYMAQHFLDFNKPIQTLFSGAISFLPEGLSAVAYNGCYLLVCWLFLYFLYKYKIFLKV